MDWTAVILGALGLAAGGVLKGATGAGAPIVGVPLIAMLYDVKLAVVVFVLPNLLSNLWQGWRFRREQRSRLLVWGFALAGAIGVSAGTLVLAQASPRVLLLTVAAAVLLYIAFRLARPDWVLGYSLGQRLAAPAGFAGGMLQGMAGLSAPISITFLNAMRLERGEFIATISVFFALMSFPQIALLWGFGLMTPERAGLSLLACLPLFGAMPLGSWLARHVSRKVFDRLILALLAVVALRLLVVGLT